MFVNIRLASIFVFSNYFPYFTATHFRDVYSYNSIIYSEMTGRLG